MGKLLTQTIMDQNKQKSQEGQTQNANIKRVNKNLFKLCYHYISIIAIMKTTTAPSS